MITRRKVLKLISTSALLSKLGILSISKTWAARPANAFNNDNPQSTLDVLFPDKTITPSDRIHIELPDVAENGAIVPVTVKTDLAPVHSINLIGEKNPVSLIAQFIFQGDGFNKTDEKRGQYLRTRIKLAKSSHLIVVINANDKLYRAEKYIKVFKGGCN